MPAPVGAPPEQGSAHSARTVDDAPAVAGPNCVCSVFIENQTASGATFYVVGPKISFDLDKETSAVRRKPRVLITAVTLYRQLAPPLAIDPSELTGNGESARAR